MYSLKGTFKLHTIIVLLNLDSPLDFLLFANLSLTFSHPCLTSHCSQYRHVNPPVPKLNCVWSHAIPLSLSQHTPPLVLWRTCLHLYFSGLIFSHMIFGHWIWSILSFLICTKPSVFVSIVFTNNMLFIYIFIDCFHLLDYKLIFWELYYSWMDSQSLRYYCLDYFT